MPDHSRVYDGFGPLTHGVDSGRAPSIIQNDQLATAVNLTMRGSFMRTRPPFESLPLTYAPRVKDRFVGKFQGGMFYESEQSAKHIIARGGRLFTITTDGNNLV